MSGPHLGGRQADPERGGPAVPRGIATSGAPGDPAAGVLPERRSAGSQPIATRHAWTIAPSATRRTRDHESLARDVSHHAPVTSTTKVTRPAVASASFAPASHARGASEPGDRCRRLEAPGRAAAPGAGEPARRPRADCGGQRRGGVQRSPVERERPPSGRGAVAERASAVPGQREHGGHDGPGRARAGAAGRARVAAAGRGGGSGAHLRSGCQVGPSGRPARRPCRRAWRRTWRHPPRAEGRKG